MHDLFIRVKGIIKQGDKYLVLKRWVDDRIVEPFVWEFVDCELEKGESPEQAVLRAVHEAIGVEGEIVRPLYTWSQMIGEVQCVGITYLCHLSVDEGSLMLSEEYSGFEWITEEELPVYIDNPNVLNDIKSAMGDN
ncbi:MAG: NUDIX domain-containing protein [Lachnospiraceae bacterium]|nr:NUDIX domain-containing protein [Lachnospiraceae bacterium]